MMKKRLLIFAMIATGISSGLTAYLLIGRMARTVDVLSVFSSAMAFGVSLALTIRTFRESA